MSSAANARIGKGKGQMGMTFPLVVQGRHYVSSGLWSIGSTETETETRRAEVLWSPCCCFVALSNYKGIVRQHQRHTVFGVYQHCFHSENIFPFPEQPLPAADRQLTGFLDSVNALKFYTTLDEMYYDLIYLSYSILFSIFFCQYSSNDLLSKFISTLQIFENSIAVVCIY